VACTWTTWLADRRGMRLLGLVTSSLADGRASDLQWRKIYVDDTDIQDGRMDCWRPARGERGVRPDASVHPALDAADTIDLESDNERRSDELLRLAGHHHWLRSARRQ